MNKLLPGRNHTSILTYSFYKIVALLIFFALILLSPNQVSAASCCPSGSKPNSGGSCCPVDMTYYPNTNTCARQQRSTEPSVMTCDLNTERCSNNVCIPLEIPTEIECSLPGYGGQCPPALNASHGFTCDTKVNRAGKVCCTNATACKTFNETSTELKDYQKSTICSYTDNSAECTACLGDGGEGGGVWTALGCIHYGQDTFTLELVKIIIGIASAISLVMMLIGAVLYMTGGGNTEQLKRGRELFTGALVGLLFLIFSVVILQIITRDIIQIDIGM